MRKQGDDRSHLAQAGIPISTEDSQPRQARRNYSFLRAVPPGLVPGLIGRLGDPNFRIVGLSQRALRGLAQEQGTVAEVRRFLWPGEGEPRPPAERLLALQACELVAEVKARQPEVEAILWEALVDNDPKLVQRAVVQLTDFRLKYNQYAFQDEKVLGRAYLSSNARVRSLATEQLYLLGDRAFACVLGLFAPQ